MSKKKSLIRFAPDVPNWIRRAVKANYKTLRLQDWSIDVMIADCVADGSHCDVDTDYLRAAIFISPSATKKDINRTVMHEMNHIVLADLVAVVYDDIFPHVNPPVDKVLGGVFNRVFEQTNERLTNIISAVSKEA